jgi:CheY-like chemotaxis protein
MASKSGDRSLVLLVDDCAENREMYAEFLADEFRIAQAGDGHEALEMALALIPDLVVMDLMLPGMSGAEVSHRLKRDTRTADMPVVVLSGQQLADAVVGSPAAWDAFLTKPCRPATLAAEIRRILYSRTA